MKENEIDVLNVVCRCANCVELEEKCKKLERDNGFLEKWRKDDKEIISELRNEINFLTENYGQSVEEVTKEHDRLRICYDNLVKNKVSKEHLIDYLIAKDAFYSKKIEELIRKIESDKHYMSLQKNKK